MGPTARRIPAAAVPRSAHRSEAAAGDSTVRSPRRPALFQASVLLLFLPGLAAAQEVTGSLAEGGAGWLSLLPPVLAIALALILKDVVVALFLGVLGGALILTEGNLVLAVVRTVDQFVVDALTDPDHAAILTFSALLGGMVGVISKSGGMQGIVERLSPLATSRRRAQAATWLMGVLIYFDDYANTLIVGTTMRPITDRLRISREKLAYIVDSTAAPIASLIPLSTWIGFEIGLLQDAFTQLESPRGDAFGTIVRSIPYRFYVFFALVLGLTIALSRRDFGPMLAAERRAGEQGELVADGETPLSDFSASELEPPPGAPLRGLNAGVPILTVVTVTLLGLWLTGSAGSEPVAGESVIDELRRILSAANSYKALIWASLSGLLVAGMLAVGQRILDIRQTSHAALEGIKAMLGAFVVLLFAWSLGDVCSRLGTADFLVEITSGVLAPQVVPVLTFILAAAISFATGTAWGTMGILMPLIVPLADSLLLQAGLLPQSPSHDAVFLGTIAAVLSGSVWGDHCSPISDTTILSSMASGCDHLAHVRTQLPYAVTAGTIAMVVGNLPTAFGASPWLALAVGTAVVVGVVWWRGRVVETPVEAG